MSGFLPTLFAADVEASSRWYQELFGVHSAHGGPEFEMLVASKGGHDIVLQLHKDDGEEHGTVVTPGAPAGSGVVLYFQVADIDTVHATHAKAVAMGAVVVKEPWANPLAHHTEFVLRDPDGYALAVHSPFSP